MGGGNSGSTDDAWIIGSIGGIVEQTKDMEQITLTPAQEAELAKSARAEQCNREMSEILKKWGCQLVPVVTIANGQITMQVQVVAV